MKVNFLKGSKIYLRPYDENDITMIHLGKNDSTVRETLFLFEPTTIDQVKAEILSWINNKEIVLFTICDNESDVAVGQTAFVRIDHVSRAAVFYIAIYNPEYWSRGFASDATKLMLKYAFDILNLNRVQLHVSSENDHAIKAYKKAGFVIEGTLREAMYHNNKYVDFYVMSILRNEYYNPS